MDDLDGIRTPWIKICGLTLVENAMECASAGADAIGLVFCQKSPRNISIDRAAEICSALPDHINTIGVFVNESYEFIMERVNKCGLKGVQLHGSESPELIDRLLAHDLIVIKALFAAKEPLLNSCDKYQNASYLLVEYGKGILPGGNAETWNYEILNQVESNVPLVLAGGLDPDNVSGAIKAANPAAVDISSGVEKTYGIKDIDKVQSFISAVKTIKI